MTATILKLSSRVGIEHEAFLWSSDSPATELEFSEFLNAIASANSTSNVGQASLVLETPSRTKAVISCDGYPHIVEISLEPHVTWMDLSSDLHFTLDALRRAAERANLRFLDVSMAVVPKTVTLHSGLGASKRSRFEWFIENRLQHQPFSDSAYLAMAAATQVTLDADLTELLPALPAIYTKLYLVPLLFSASNKAASHNSCTRLLLFRDNYPLGYRAKLIPVPIPTTLEDYSILIGGECVERDFSFVAPRPGALVEFRPACSQPSVERIGELAAFYLATLHGALSKRLSTRDDSATMIWSVCEGRSVKRSRLNRDLHELEGVSIEIGPEFRMLLNSLIARARQMDE